MGMFDSFRIDINDKIYEIQTKKFDCLLNVWSIGDVIEEHSFLSTVIVEKVYELDKYFAAVIYQGIFVDYLIRDTFEEAAEDVTKLMKLFMSEINNPIVDYLIKALRKKTKELNDLNDKKNSVLAGMSDVINFLEKDEDKIFNKENNRFFSFIKTWEDSPEPTVSMEEKYKYLLTKIKDRAKIEFPEYLPWSYNEEIKDFEQVTD